MTNEPSPLVLASMSFLNSTIRARTRRVSWARIDGADMIEEERRVGPGLTGAERRGWPNPEVRTKQRQSGRETAFMTPRMRKEIRWTYGLERRSFPRHHECEPECLTERMFIFKSVYVAEVKCIDIVPQACTVGHELPIPIFGILIEIPDPQGDQSRTAVPVFKSHARDDVAKFFAEWFIHPGVVDRLVERGDFPGGGPSHEQFAEIDNICEVVEFALKNLIAKPKPEIHRKRVCLGFVDIGQIGTDVREIGSNAEGLSDVHIGKMNDDGTWPVHHTKVKAESRSNAPAFFLICPERRQPAVNKPCIDSNAEVFQDFRTVPGRYREFISFEPANFLRAGRSSPDEFAKVQIGKTGRNGPVEILDVLFIDRMRNPQVGEAEPRKPVGVGECNLRALLEGEPCGIPVLCPCIIRKGRSGLTHAARSGIRRDEKERDCRSSNLLGHRFKNEKARRQNNKRKSLHHNNILRKNFRPPPSLIN